MCSGKCHEPSAATENRMVLCSQRAGLVKATAVPQPISVVALAVVGDDEHGVEHKVRLVEARPKLNDRAHTWRSTTPVVMGRAPAKDKIFQESRVNLSENRLVSIV